MTGKSLMLIGGSGFFGKSFLDAWSRDLLAPWAVERIIVVARRADRLVDDHPMLLGDHVTLMNADAGTVATLPHADYVIHAASSTDAGRYLHSPLEERANILRSIENYCRIAAIDHFDSKILYTSSGAVYGQQPADLDRVGEDYVPGPSAGLTAYKRDYAEAKRLAEQRIARLGDHGLQVTIARCFAFIGMFLPRDQHFAIGNFIADGLNGVPIKVHARHPVYRSYMHADDLVRWLMTMVDHADPSCPVFNVGSDEAMQITDVAGLVARKLGVTVQTVPADGSMVDRYVPQVDLARRTLGLSNVLDLERAVDDVIERIRYPAQWTSR